MQGLDGSRALPSTPSDPHWARETHSPCCPVLPTRLLTVLEADESSRRQWCGMAGHGWAWRVAGRTIARTARHGPNGRPAQPCLRLAYGPACASQQRRLRPIRRVASGPDWLLQRQLAPAQPPPPLAAGRRGPGRGLGRAHRQHGLALPKLRCVRCVPGPKATVDSGSAVQMTQNGVLRNRPTCRPFQPQTNQRESRSPVFEPS